MNLLTGKDAVVNKHTEGDCVLGSRLTSIHQPEQLGGEWEQLCVTQVIVSVCLFCNTLLHKLRVELVCVGVCLCLCLVLLHYICVRWRVEVLNNDKSLPSFLEPRIVVHVCQRGTTFQKPNSLVLRRPNAKVHP